MVRVCSEGRRGVVARVIAIACVGVWASTSDASAAVIFVDTQAAFTTSVAGLINQGTEDFESSTLAPNSIVAFTDPLAPGVANAPFPNGTLIALGLTIQSNNLGGAPATVSAGGWLATASAGYASTPTNQVSSNNLGHSFDMIFGLGNTTAVSFNPLVFDANATNGPGTLQIRVFDHANNLIASQDGIAAAAYGNPTTFIGVVAGPAETIGRVNVFGTGNIQGGGVIEYTGADNITVYTAAPQTQPQVAEPATMFLLGGALVAMSLRRWTM